MISDREMRKRRYVIVSESESEDLVVNSPLAARVSRRGSEEK